MPYCVKQLQGGTYVLLNRDYKPIGFYSAEFVSYNGYPIAHEIKSLTPEIAAQISYNSDPSITLIYLYGDGSVPTENKKNWDSYMKRLELLMKLHVE